jgi:hypothetical protein
MKTKDKTRIIVPEVEFWIRNAKHAWINHKRNENRLQELKTEIMLERVSGYTTEGMQHDDRAKRNINKELLITKIAWFRNRERSLKRLLDDCLLEGHRLLMARRNAHPNEESYAGGCARCWYCNPSQKGKRVGARRIAIPGPPSWGFARG